MGKQEHSCSEQKEVINVPIDTSDFSRVFTDLPPRGAKLHFVGVGGIGMSAVALGFRKMGFDVSGSDLQENSLTTRLRGRGCAISLGHGQAELKNVNAVVVSSAIPADNVELAEARRRGIPVLHRSQAAQLLLIGKRTVAVGGSHGKTTISAMISHLLAESGMDPTSIVGGVTDCPDGNLRIGGGRWAVVEADESDRSILNFTPELAVVNNVDLDHVDNFKNVAEVREMFLSFCRSVISEGFCFLGWDSPEVRRMAEELERGFIGYGSCDAASLRFTDYRPCGSGSSFLVWKEGVRLGEMSLAIPGHFNAVNSLAAVAVGLHLEVPFERIADSLERYRGVERRFDLRGEAGGVVVLDDYAHHPAEIRATLSALEERYGGRKVVVFQPHRYSRTRAFAREFAESLREADVLLLTEVYPSGEAPMEGVTGRAILDHVEDEQDRALYVEALEEIPGVLVDGVLEAGDVLITVGAGDVWKVGREVLDRLGDTEES